MEELFAFDEIPEPIELPGQLAFFPDKKPKQPTVPHKRSYPAMSQLTLNDPHLVSILLCCILLRFEGHLSERWLYEIVVSSGHISYFLYADAVGFLLDNGSVAEEQDSEQNTMYYLTKRGVACAESLRQYVPKPFRDQVMLTALRYVSRQRAIRELSMRYEPDDDGVSLCLSCKDGNHDMFSLRVHAPSKESAEMLGERILRNPAGFFGKIIDIAMNNEEENFDLSDN